MSFKVTLSDGVKTFDKKIKLKDLTQGNKEIICANVNGRIRELDYDLHYDSTISFLTVKDNSAMGIYERGVRYIFSMAARNLFPNVRFKLSYSISRSIYARVESGELSLTPTIVREIEKEMKRIVEQDYEFERKIISNEEADKLYNEFGLKDKEAILKFRPEKTVHIYKCDNYINYMYGKMVPSTGYLKDAHLIFYPPGILIQYPRSEQGGKIPLFHDEPMFQSTLEGSDAWSELVRASTVADINALASVNLGTNLINICENRHNRMLVELADTIVKKLNTIRVICVAGPSSSGKTTLADRITLELNSRGINPIRISIDDYYKLKDEVPFDENGERDYESLNALDVDLFNDDLLRVLSGEEVTLPTFDFKSNRRIYERKVKLSKKDPVIIEGIHALNEAMTPLIPKQLKFKVYISPQAQINLDFENPISLTDIRLIRRIVRDNKYRNSSAEETIAMWPSVRRGEFKWIYRTQENADFVFDTFLNYEPCIMKKYALPLLLKIDKDGPYGPDSERLIKFLKYFVDIEDTYIPCNSILKEFIGGSCYRDV